jgi:hypothetical protein
MEQQAGGRPTIGEWMAWIGALALVLSLFQVRTAGDAWLIAGLAAAVPILYELNLVVDVLVGIRCPGCGRWKLRRLTRVRSFACCACCGRRFKRSFLGPWRDASGPDDDAVIRGKARRWSWIGSTIPQEHDASTTGVLLRNQRRRRCS